MNETKPKSKTKHGAPSSSGEQWGLDPRDVQFHRRRMRQAKAVGPLGKFFRFGAAALALAAAVAVYLNFDTLRRIRFDFSALTGVFQGDAAGSAGTARSAGEPGSETVEGAGVVGVSMPTSLDDTAPEAAPVAAAAPAAGPAAAAPAPAENPILAVAPPEPVPEEPPTPETFGFGLGTMNVSEADASAAVLILRDGGRRGVSFVTWWTTDGTASAGTDFARLEPRVERFSVGEQNRTIHVPIVGDRNVEGPESFYVQVTPGESATAEPVAKIEVVIVDDD